MAVSTNAACRLSPEQQEALRMRESLDEGDVGSAMRLARRLMWNKDGAVRSEVLTVLGWIGKRALPELTELLNGSDGEWRSEALPEWEKAYDELTHDFDRAKWILAAVTNLEDRGEIDAILFKAQDLDEAKALPLLERIAEAGKGRPVNLAAQDMFEYIAGEPWSSPERTALLVKKLSKK